MNPNPGLRNAFAFSLSSAFVLGLLTSGAAFARQALIAGYFGVGPEMDAYFMTFAIATFLALTPGTVFQNAVVPRLVRAREKTGREEFGNLAGAVLALSLLFSIAVGLLFMILGPLAVHLLAPGFDGAKKAIASGLCVHFLPWILLAAPYNALGAILKSGRRYALPLSAELLLTLVSGGVLWLRHGGVRDIAIAYFAGHAAACLWLLPHVIREAGARPSFRVEGLRAVVRNMAELYGSMQLGVLAGVVERMYQSYLATGGIAALAYATQLSNAISGLLGFKQIYVVPLSDERNRAEKLERLLTGLIFLTLPIVVLLSFYARPIVQLLYQRGRFDGVASGQTATILSVLAFGILSATLNAPLARMYQVMDRIKFNGVIQAASIAVFLVFGYLFLFVLGLGAMGLAMAVVLNSYLAVAVQLALLRRCGLVLDLARLGRVLAQSILSNAAVLVVLEAVFGRLQGRITELLALGAAWAAVTLLVYTLNWRTLKWALKA